MLQHRLGKNWLPFIYRIAYSRIKDTTVLFQSHQFYDQRTVVQAAIYDKLSSALTDYTNGAVVLMNLQMSSVALDTTVEFPTTVSSKPQSRTR